MQCIKCMLDLKGHGLYQPANLQTHALTLRAADRLPRCLLHRAGAAEPRGMDAGQWIA